MMQFSSTKEFHGQYMSEQTPRKSPRKKGKYALIPVAKVPTAAFAQQRVFVKLRPEKLSKLVRFDRF